MRPQKNNYGSWSKEELRKAESTATRFLQDNAGQISETLRAKVRYLELLVGRLSAKDATLDQRLDHFARLAEIAQLLKEDAEGFFELASQPLVARILQGVNTPRG